jgi:putative flippase GtrA
VKTALRFGRYSALSLITVPVGYALLLLLRRVWPINAGILNLIVGTVLTVPSFLLYRHFVWPAADGRMWRALYSFWQTVILGALAASALIALADALFSASNVLIVLAGLVGQGLVFVGRFFWLDNVTFQRQPSPSAEP